MNLGLVGLLPPPTLPGLKPPIRVAVSGFISIGDCGPRFDIIKVNPLIVILKQYQNM